MKIHKTIITALILILAVQAGFAQKMTSFRVDKEFSDKNDIRAIRFDNNNNMWLATGFGVFKQTSSGFEMMLQRSEFVEDLVFDENNNIWTLMWITGVVSSKDGGKSWTAEPKFNHTLPFGLKANGDKVFVGFWNRGLQEYSGEWKQVPFTDSLNITVNKILTDSKKHTWLGTFNGVYNYDINSGKAILYDKNNSKLPSNNIYSITEDNKNNVWVGTDQGLINIHNQKQVFTIENSPLPSNSITALHCDSKNRIWIGTPKGLVILEKNKWGNFDTQNSNLAGNRIQFITEKDGKYYLATDRGYTIVEY